VVVRAVPAHVDPIAYALRAEIEGPTPSEEQKGIVSPFHASASDPKVPPLSPDQVKLKVQGGNAVVDFAPAASAYLLQAICARTTVTTAIEQTLLQFPEITRVDFAIGGEIIVEWDA
jgi:hypothetical protein